MYRDVFISYLKCSDEIVSVCLFGNFLYLIEKWKLRNPIYPNFLQLHFPGEGGGGNIHIKGLGYSSKLLGVNKRGFGLSLGD